MESVCNSAYEVRLCSCLAPDVVGRVGRPLVSVLTQTVYGSLGESLLISVPLRNFEEQTRTPNSSESE